MDLWSIGGGGGVNLPWVYVHCAIYDYLFGVMVFQTSMLDYRTGGVNLPWVYVHCAIYIIIWCNGFPDIYAQLEHDYCVPCFTL